MRISFLLLIFIIFMKTEIVAINPGSYGFFMRNSGQFDSRFGYCLKSKTSNSYFNSTEVYHQFQYHNSYFGSEIETICLHLSFINANHDVSFSECNPLVGSFNYLIGRDTSKWITNQRIFGELLYHNLYESTDVIFHVNGNSIENDFIIHPDGNIDDIGLRYNNVECMSINNNGELIYKIGSAKFKEIIPEAFQIIHGRKINVELKYVLMSGNLVKFKAAKYNHDFDLIIDPQLFYLSYFGGSGDDFLYQSNIEKDIEGNIYFCGRTTSDDLPIISGGSANINHGAMDAFIIKMDPTATQIIFCTYIGGSNSDYATCIKVVPGSNEILLSGFTQSGNFPTTANAYQPLFGGDKDGFIMRLNASGNEIQFSTYLGSYGYFEDYIVSIELSPTQDIYFVGYSSGNFPTTQNAYQSANSDLGSYDMIIGLISDDLDSLILSTMIGGNYHDRGYNLKLDYSGNLCVYGTSGGNFPMTAGAFDIQFNGGTNDIALFKMNSALSTLLHSTYLGSVADEIPRGYGGLWINAQNQMIVTGNCGSGFPTTNGAFIQTYSGGSYDAFVSILSENLSNLIASTYIGGPGEDCGYYISGDSNNNIIISGYAANGFPTTACSYDQTFNGGTSDAFISKFNSSLSQLLYSSYLGGNNSEIANAFVVNNDTAIIIGETRSSDLPVTSNAFDPTFNSGDRDVFIARLSIIGSSAIVYAGNDLSTCESSSVSISTSTASNYSSLLWTTSGTGTFNNPALLHPTYTPSLDDETLGSVTLTLTATATTACPPTSDNMILSILHQAIVNAGPDTTICENSAYTLSYASATNAVSYLWTTSGTGLFSNPTILHPLYYPSYADLNAGTVTLTLTGIPVEPCNSITDFMILHFSKQAIVNAGPDSSICESGPFLISGATSQYCTSYIWTSSGTGTFNNPGILNPIYTPSINDISNGSVILSLNGTSVTPCINDSDAMLLHILSNPTVNAGPDEIICEGGTYTLNSAFATNAASYLWTTSGTGSFSDASILNPTYSPSFADITAGSVNLTLTGIAAYPCSNMTDFMVLHFSRQAFVNAGPDGAVCEFGPFQISGATSQYCTSYIWTSSGSGTFNNPGILNPIYSPSANDIINGSVTLILNGTSVTPCMGTSDAMVLLIMKNSLVNAGSDDTICEYSGIYTLGNATAQNAVSYSWTTNGTGSFNNATILNPTYYPSLSDIISGNVVLGITANSSEPCEISRDSMSLFIIRQAVVTAGPDGSVCPGLSYQILGAASQYTTDILWTSSGTGSFSNSAILDPIYTPSIDDIASGQVVLTLNVSSVAPCTEASDSMTLLITTEVLMNAGPDDSMCESAGSYTLTHTSTNATSFLWTTSGTGSFNNPTVLHPVYTPSQEDITAGSVQLFVHASSPCGIADDTMNLNFTRQAVVVAGSDISSCGSIPVSFSEANAQHGLTYSWYTDGTGTFNNPQILNPIYIPSSIDIEKGIIKFELNVTSLSPCMDVSDTIVLYIRKEAIVNAGKDDTVCKSDPYVFLGASASYFNTIEWTHTGLGTLQESNTLSPTYLPALEESGNIIFTIKASGISPCSDVTDQKYVKINHPVVINSIGNYQTCETEAVYISGVNAQNFTSCLWVSNGSGSFNDSTKLNPVYYPSSMDVEKGSIILTLNLTGQNECADAAQPSILTLSKKVTVYAGGDTICCENGIYKVSDASANHQVSLYWLHEPISSGQLTDANTLTPTFIPTPTYTGIVYLTLFAEGNPGCDNNESIDQKTIEYIPSPHVDAGSDQTIEESSVVLLTATVTGGLGEYSWKWEPSSLLSNPLIYNPVTEPINKDTSFIVRVLDNLTGCFGSDTVNILINNMSIASLEIYNIITPNKDSKNDRWIISGIEEFPDNDVIVFNQWGDKIADFHGYNNSTVAWEGKNNRNEFVPDGSYFYVLTLRNKGVRTGWIYVQSKH